MLKSDHSQVSWNTYCRRRLLNVLKYCPLTGHRKIHGYSFPNNKVNLETFKKKVKTNVFNIAFT